MWPITRYNWYPSNALKINLRDSFITNTAVIINRSTWSRFKFLYILLITIASNLLTLTMTPNCTDWLSFNFYFWNNALVHLTEKYQNGWTYRFANQVIWWKVKVAVNININLICVHFKMHHWSQTWSTHSLSQVCMG